MDTSEEARRHGGNCPCTLATTGAVPPYNFSTVVMITVVNKFLPEN